SGEVLRPEHYDSSNCRNPTRTRLRSVDEAPALHAAALRQGDDVPCARCLSRRNGANRIDRRRPVLRAVGSRFANAKKETVSAGTSLAPEHPVSGSVRYLCQNGASPLRNPKSSRYQNSRDSWLPRLDPSYPASALPRLLARTLILTASRESALTPGSAAPLA